MIQHLQLDWGHFTSTLGNCQHDQKILNFSSSSTKRQINPIIGICSIQNQECELFVTVCGLIWWNDVHTYISKPCKRTYSYILFPYYLYIYDTRNTTYHWRYIPVDPVKAPHIKHTCIIVMYDSIAAQRKKCWVSSLTVLVLPHRFISPFGIIR